MMKTDQHTKGRLFIISAPSGAGKTTLCGAVLKHFDDMCYSISHTTRPPRKGEQEGVDYFFVDKARFTKGIEENKWAEWAEVHGNYYGTSADVLEQKTASGVDVLLDIDVQGARQICRRYPESVTIFIMPPSIDILRNRLKSRGAEDTATVRKRLKNAVDEIAQKDFYRHVIVNDQLNKAIDDLIATISQYRNP